MKILKLMLLLMAAVLSGCGNKQKQEIVKVATINSDVVVDSCSIEEGQFYNIGDKRVFCKTVNDTSVILEVSLPLKEDELRRFSYDNHIKKNRVISLFLASVDLPAYATFKDYSLIINDDVASDEVFKSEISKRKEEIAKKERLAMEEKKRQEEQQRIETERRYRSEAKEFEASLNTITIGTTMEDFNEAIQRLSSITYEYYRIKRSYGELSSPLKNKLIAKQKNVFEIIRKRYIAYFRGAFAAAGMNMVRFEQSGTTLTLRSDVFYEQIAITSAYESMIVNMKDYRFKKLIFKSSNGKIIDQYNIESKDDVEL